MGKEKGLVEFNGRPLIEYSLEALASHCSEILISTSSQHYNYLDFPTVPDEIPGIGPMGGIYSCLKASSNKMNFVLSCDMPFITQSLIGYLVSKPHYYQAVIPWHGDDHYEPLCGRYHSSLIPRMEDFIRRRNYKLPDLFRKIRLMPVKLAGEYPQYREEIFLNINDSNDLLKAEKFIQKG